MSGVRMSGSARGVAIPTCRPVRGDAASGRAYIRCRLLNMDDVAIRLENVTKRFNGLPVLSGISGAVRRGEFIAVCGPSGSGKSTLVRTINRLESIDSGSVLVHGVDVQRVPVNALRRNIGFVFQSFNLFNHMTARENISVVLERAGRVGRKAAAQQALELLDQVGMAEKADELPRRLSGGQQQRVAIARAIALAPQIILLDEPTSALDPELVSGILDLLLKLAGNGTTIMCVTHEMGFARNTADRVWFLQGGRLVLDRKTKEFFADRSGPAGAFLAAIAA